MAIPKGSIYFPLGARETDFCVRFECLKLVIPNYQAKRMADKYTLNWNTFTDHLQLMFKDLYEEYYVDRDNWCLVVLCLTVQVF